MPTTAPRSAPCSTGSMGQWRPSPAMAPTTATTSTPRSRPAIPLRPWSCRRARMRCRATAAETAPTQRDRHLRCIAERGRMGWQRASGYNWRALVEADISRWKRVIGDGLRFADGRATGDRGGHRRRRAEPNAGAGTPGVRPHRITRNTGRAQCVHTADPCNKAPLRRPHGARLRSFRRRPGAHGAGIGGRQPRADDAEDRGGATAPLGK